MNIIDFESMSVDQLATVDGGKNPVDPTTPTSTTNGNGVSLLDKVNIDVKADLNKGLDSGLKSIQRVASCWFGTDSTRDFGRCLSDGKFEH